MTMQTPVPSFGSLDDGALDQLFREARTHYAWLSRPVPEALLRQAVELAKMGPTHANAQPMRVLFVKSPEAKEKLKAALAPGNVEKTMTAPVTAIVAHDMAFVDLLPRVLPHMDARPWFANNQRLVEETAKRNSALAGAYLLLALRAVGLDTGPMSGFDNAKVDELFFADSTWRSNFLINIGYGDRDKTFPRNPRLSFEEIARFA